jgi:acyl carrier protein
MGIDFLDLTFRCEKEFGIKLDREEFPKLVSYSPYNRWCESGTLDIRVCDFVMVVEETIKRQHPDFDGFVFDRIRPHIADCLAISEFDVTPDSWLIQDLGMS